MTLAALVFPIGEDRYAVAANTVREVVAEPRPTRLPTVAPVLLGVFNLRGEVVPIFDVAALLGIGVLGDGPFAVVTTTISGPAALVAGGLPRVATLDEPIAASQLRGTLGVYAVDDGVAVLLDVEALLLAHTGMNAGVVEAVLV